MGPGDWRVEAVSLPHDCTHRACPQPCKRRKSEAGSRLRPGREGGSRKGAKPRSRTSVILDRRASHNTCFGGRSPDKNQSGRDEHGKRHVGPVRRKRPATFPREQTCKGLFEEPYERGRTCRRSPHVRPSRAEPGSADSGTPRAERTAVHDRPRAAGAILAQSDMVGEPSPGYHDEPLAGLMTPPRIQRSLLPLKRPMWQTRLNGAESISQSSHVGLNRARLAKRKTARADFNG